MAKHTSHKLIKGLGAAALVSAAAAAYYLNGPQSKKHRQKAKAWAKTAKKEFSAKLSKMQKVGRDGYQKAAAEVISKYRQAKNIKPEELAAFGRELKGHWANIQKAAKKLSAPKKTVKKSARSAKSGKK